MQLIFLMFLKKSPLWFLPFRLGAPLPVLAAAPAFCDFCSSVSFTMTVANHAAQQSDR